MHITFILRVIFLLKIQRLSSFEDKELEKRQLQRRIRLAIDQEHNRSLCKHGNLWTFYLFSDCQGNDEYKTCGGDQKPNHGHKNAPSRLLRISVPRAY